MPPFPVWFQLKPTDGGVIARGIGQLGRSNILAENLGNRGASNYESIDTRKDHRLDNAGQPGADRHLRQRRGSDMKADFTFITLSITTRI
jgi:hypothetical protein